MIDKAVPTPDQDSGSASTFATLRILARAGYSVTFAAPALADAGRYTKALNDLGIATPTAPEWTSLRMVIEALAPRSDVALLYRGKTAAGPMRLSRRVAPGMKIVFDPVDLHFLRMEREAALMGDQSREEAAAAMRVIELDAIRQADATVVVSSYESRLLAELVPDAVVHQVPMVRETPPQPAGVLGWRRLAAGLSGRGLGAFGRRLARSRPDFVARRDFLFIGGFGHQPNIDAVHWFAREVWPRLQAAGFPNRFIIVGSKLPAEVAALASPGIEVRGHVADLAPLFNSCRLSVAPLRYGAGVKGKIVTSLSYGVPVVATSIAVEGMDLQKGEGVLVADDPDEMARQILRLYTDADLWRRLSSQGYEAFNRQFSEASGAAKVVAVFDDLVAQRAR